MKQGRAARIKWRIEPEPAFTRRLQPHAHIQDKKVMVTRFPGEVESQQMTYRTAGAVGCQHIRSTDGARTIGGCKLKAGSIIALHDARYFVLPVHFAALHRFQCFVLPVFQFVLGYVDEARVASVRLGRGS